MPKAIAQTARTSNPLPAPAPDNAGAVDQEAEREP